MKEIDFKARRIIKECNFFLVIDTVTLRLGHKDKFQNSVRVTGAIEHEARDGR